MTKFAALIALTCALSAPAFAQEAPTGDVSKGKKAFKKCKSCHQIKADDGTVIVKGGRTGPNLYGVVGRQAGTLDGFKYGKSLVAAGEKDLVWDEEHFTSYVADPKKFLRTYLEEGSARSKMSFKLKKGAADIYAYLASVVEE